MALNPFVIAGGAAALFASSTSVVISEASTLIFGVDIDPSTLIPIGSVTGFMGVVLVAFLRRTREQDTRSESQSDKAVAWANKQRDDAIAERDAERRARVREAETFRQEKQQIIASYEQEVAVKERRIVELTNILLEVRQANPRVRDIELKQTLDTKELSAPEGEQDGT